jgi:hypothetical protein
MEFGARGGLRFGAALLRRLGIDEKSGVANPPSTLV